MSQAAESFVVGLLIIAGLYVLVNPNSQGPGLITSVTGGLSQLIGTAMGTGASATTAAK